MNSVRLHAFRLAAFLVLGCLAREGLAQTPTISALSPRAIKPGGSVDLLVRGTGLKGATGLWTSLPADAVLAPDVPENGAKADQVTFRVTLPANAGVGVHGVRVLTPQGASALKLLVVDDLPSVAQAANNTSEATAQALTPPIAVDGTVGNLGRQYFKMQAAAGQTLSIEVLARRIGSPLDPMIRLLDATGRELTYSDDEPGLMADARLSHTFVEAGEYLIEVRDIRYQGGGNHVFRLRVGDFPCLTVPYPMGAKRGTQATLSFAGEAVDGVQPVALTVPTDPDLDWLSVGARRRGGQSSGFAVLAVGDRDEVVEAEPNDAAEQATRVTLGTNLNGRFEQPGDVDRYIFTAKQNQKFSFAAVTRQQGSPADLFLQVLKPDGSKLAEADDAPPLDAVLNVTFPADGDYTLLVEDLNRRGGPEFAYRIETAAIEAGFTLAASADTLNVPAGGAALVTVTAARHSYSGPIAIEAVGLPPGLSSGSALIGPGQTSCVLTIQSTAETPAGGYAAMKIVGTAKAGDRELRATATVSEALKASLSNVPWTPLVLAEATAVGTSPAPPFALRAEPVEIILGRDLSAKFKVKAQRQADFSEAIALAVTPEKNGVPAGITIAAQPIAVGAGEVEITVSANGQAPLGEFTAVLLGTLKKGKATHTQPVPGIRLKLTAPLTLAVDAGAAKLARGGELKLKVNVERNPALAAPIELALQNLPKGVTAEAVTLAADQQEVEITLKAAADAAPGAVTNLRVRGTATVGSAKLTGDSPAVAVMIE